jgi:hypothetical protein
MSVRTYQCQVGLRSDLMAGVGRRDRQAAALVSGTRVVDEIWILETPFYDNPFGRTYFRFERYERRKLVRRKRSALRTKDRCLF